METKHNAPEQRIVDVDVQDIDTRGKTVVGYAAVYGSEAQLDGFTETIKPGAFAGVLSDDVRALLNHDANIVLGRTKSGTLRLADDQRGLRFELDLPESRKDLREAIARGDLDGASFRFRIGDDEWDGDRRTVNKIAALHDITLATYPAYPDTSIELRTRPAAPEENKMQDEKKNEERSCEELQQERPHAGSLHVEERADIGAVHTLAELYEQRGFTAKGEASVSWDEFRSFTWSAGTVLTDLNPVRREGYPLGYDTRWLYPVLPTTGVSAATTAVQYLRQSSRSLAGTATIRALDAVSTKPESSSTVEYKTQQLEQVAAVSSGIPRIHSLQPMFQSVVESDLRLSVSDGLDEIVRRGVNTAGTAAGVSGDILEKARRAMTVVQSNGYNPRVLAIDPAGAEALDLLRSSGSEAFYLWGPGQGAPGGPFGLQLRVWKSSGTAVIDPDAFGRLYVSPVELKSFEADAGLTNKQNVRMETSAAYTVERLPAAVKIN
jgi:Escherichia/Staphylococcus phage prohead protease